MKRSLINRGLYLVKLFHYIYNYFYLYKNKIAVKNTKIQKINLKINNVGHRRECFIIFASIVQKSS